MPTQPPTFRPPWYSQRSEAERKQAFDKRRGSSSQRGYDWRWRKLRAVVLAEEPLCRFCGEQGFVVSAEEVDHIDGNSRNNARDNLRPLCRGCHSARTARDQGFARGRGG